MKWRFMGEYFVLKVLFPERRDSVTTLERRFKRAAWGKRKHRNTEKIKRAWHGKRRTETRQEATGSATRTQKHILLINTLFSLLLYCNLLFLHVTKLILLAIFTTKPRCPRGILAEILFHAAENLLMENKSKQKLFIFIYIYIYIYIYTCFSDFLRLLRILIIFKGRPLFSHMI